MKVTEAEAQKAVKAILSYIGEDPEREGLLDTPKRVLKAWKNAWGAGYGQNPASLMKVFEDGGEDYDQMVIVKDIKVHSHCEHHMCPIIGKAHIAYLPNKKIIGLSKLNRLVDLFARRLQVQERLTTQVAEALMTELQPRGVAVYIEADHMCVQTRGIMDVNSSTVTSSLKGIFLEDQSTKEEFLNAIK